MPSVTSFLAFGIVAFSIAITPGPNMIYVISRSLSQGSRAGLISLSGISLGFLIYMLLAAFGITAIIVAVPYAFDALRLAGAAYLLYLAWRVLRPGGRSPFEVKQLPQGRPSKLVFMGLMTNLLNPKAAMLYLALLPQFVDPSHGHVLVQSLVLGGIQVLISMTVNGSIALMAGSIAKFLARSPRWVMIQRWFMGAVLIGLTTGVLLESRR